LSIYLLPILSAIDLFVGNQSAIFPFLGGHDLSAHVRKIFVIWCIHVRGMTHSYVRHDSFICVAWLIHMFDMTHTFVWHDSFICAAWLIHMCDMTHMCDLSHAYIDRRALSQLFRVPIYGWIRDTTDLYVWHKSFICVKWLIHLFIGGHMITALPGATPLKPGSATFPMFGVGNGHWYIYTHMYVYIYIHIYYVLMYICICMITYMYIGTYTCVYIILGMWRLWSLASEASHTQIYIHTCLCTYIHICNYTYAYM